MTADPTAPDGEPIDAAPWPWSPQAAASAAPAPAPADAIPTVVLSRTPRAGELAPTWRLVTAVSWIAVAVAIGSVWKTSDQLGLSTWWIGPRGQPNPVVVQLLPFAPPLVMIVGAIAQWRRLALSGVVAALAVIAIGLGDVGRVERLGIVEVVIGAAALAVSIASFTGTYREAGDAAGLDHDQGARARVVEPADAG